MRVGDLRAVRWGVVVTALALSACSGQPPAQPPPRADDPVPIPQDSSFIAVPIDVDQQQLARTIERLMPRTLWTINRAEKACVPPQRLKLLGKQIKVTPAIGCTIIGTVTRGPIRLRGAGAEIVADVPIHAEISARDVGGVLKGETATGRAMAHAHIRLDLSNDWKPRGAVRLRYDWTTPPGIDFLGQRITFTDKADEKLRPIVRKLEADLPRELAKANVKAQAEELWKQGFAVVELNRDKPPVWMRLSPQRIVYGGYHAQAGKIRLQLGLEMLTQTFVGPKPDAPQPTPLPALEKAKPENRFHFFSPVIADYRELEPVVLRALEKRSARPFDLPGIGPVQARFGKITAYGAGDGRIAMGLSLSARPVSGTVEDTHGTIWIVAKPVNDKGSARIRFTDLSVTGDTDGMGGDMLIALGSSPAVSMMIASALEQNLTHDLDDLLGKVRRAIEHKEEGAFAIDARIDSVETGEIHAYGQGLYLPVRATGEAHVLYRPGR